MPRFTVRIELHDATWEHYQQLYETLAKLGFTDTLETDKCRFRMPPAEYNYEADITKEEVLAKAKSAAGRVVQSYGSAGDRLWWPDLARPGPGVAAAAQDRALLIGPLHRRTTHQTYFSASNIRSAISSK